MWRLAISTILIGIQARSGSTRLPKKAFALISGKMLLDRVVEACKKAAKHLNSRTQSGFYSTRVAILTPTGDQIAAHFHDRCAIYEGPEFDVLARYAGALDHFKADYVIRITGDCPLIPPFVISKMTSIAQINGYDYLSNVDDRFRTSIDGVDCEVISARLLDWLAETATDAYDREHVTPLARRSPPEWAKIGCVINHFDHSDEKLSVDTPDDLARVRLAFESANEKFQKAVMEYGHTAVHRI